MSRIPVNSNCLLSVGYDSKRHILEAEFAGGGVYRYFDVPGRLYQRLIRAASLGKFFNKEIKSRYRFTIIRKPYRAHS